MKWEAEGKKELFWVGKRKGLCKRKAFGLQKNWLFQLMKGYLIKKNFFHRAKIQFPAASK